MGVAENIVYPPSCGCCNREKHDYNHHVFPVSGTKPHLITMFDCYESIIHRIMNIHSQGIVLVNQKTH
jgi:hypothetical protein